MNKILFDFLYQKLEINLAIIFLTVKSYDAFLLFIQAAIFYNEKIKAIKK